MREICSKLTIMTPANIYLFKVNNRNPRKRYQICSELTTKTPEQGQRHRSGVCIVSFVHYSTVFSCVFVVYFKQVNVKWGFFL